MELFPQAAPGTGSFPALLATSVFSYPECNMYQSLIIPMYPILTEIVSEVTGVVRGAPGKYQP